MWLLELLRSWLRPTKPTPPPVQPVPPGGPVADAVIALVNRERARAGVPAVTADARLTAAAQKWAAEMARTGRLDHGDVGARLKAEGYSYSTLAENIAQGQRSPEEVVASWMNSPGHRRNILNPAFRHAGAGRSGAFWCLDLANS
jgi:uncharacterized protein YkwD